MSARDSGGSGERRRGWIAPLLLTALALLGPATAPGQAAAAPSKFVQELCDPALPGGGAPEWTFHANPGAAFGAFVNCSSPGGSIGIAQWGETAGTFSYMEIGVPPTPGGFIESETISGNSQGMSAGNHLSHIKAEGWPTFNAGESQRSFFLRNGLDTGILPRNGGDFSIVLSCDAKVGPCSGGSLSTRDIAVTQVDPSAPTLSGLGGSILSGELLRGHHDLSAQAADKGSGVNQIEVLVNGLPAGSPSTARCSVVNVKNAAYEGPVATSPTPCPASLEGSWVLDTAAYPFQNGTNSVQVCTSDYSTLTEPNRTCTVLKSVSVDNSCTESPVPGGEILSARFVRSHRDELTVPSSSAARVAGELTNNAGDSISGATICVQMQTQGTPGGLRPVATARTDAHGHFLYKVPPGPNRRVLLGYRHDTFQVARSVRYFAHPELKFKITPGKLHNGGMIKMWGKLPGPRAAGRVSVLQASAVHSDRWYTFERATTNRHGVFRAHYRFGATPVTTVYRIRALVPRQHGWPWETGYSRPVLVEVRE